jgi:hypothetical protein
LDQAIPDQPDSFNTEPIVRFAPFRTAQCGAKRLNAGCFFDFAPECSELFRPDARTLADDSLV